MITSTRNAKVKYLKALQSRPRRRREARSFVVEGVRLAEEVVAAGWPVKLALYTGDLNARGMAVVEALKTGESEVEVVSPAVLAAASDTQTPQGILMEVSWRDQQFPEHLELVLIVDGIRDPGNLGTLLRSAAAAGADTALVAPESADPWAPKVLRAAMGAHFRIPVIEIDWEGIEKVCAQNQLALYVAEASAGQVYDEADLRDPLALIVGGEAEGAGSTARAIANGALHIPMPGKTESLNAAIAGSLLLFEAARQRRHKDDSA